MNAILNASRVRAIFKDCFFTEAELKDGEPPEESYVVVNGVVGPSVGFNKVRLEKHRPEILEMLNDLDPKFFASSGGGYSFLKMPFDKNGEQWGEQVDANNLVMLGIGVNAVQLLVPRHMWEMLPGGVPYYLVKGEQHA